MERIEARLGNVKVTDHEAIGINSDAKEGMLFAVLAYLCVKKRVGNVPSCMLDCFK